MVLSNMENIWKDIPWWSAVLGGSVLVGGLVFVIRRRRDSTKTRIRQKNLNPRDKILICLTRGSRRGLSKTFKNPVPRVEIFLSYPQKWGMIMGSNQATVYTRSELNSIRERDQVVVSLEASSKGKFPWIEYNNETVADSEFCIQFLNSKRGVNLNSHLTPEQEGVGRAIQKMLEENTYWIMVLDRWYFDETNGLIKFIQLPWYVIRHFKNKLYNQAYNQGIARHSKEEILQILRLDLSALSKYLGSKKFLFGNQACQYDCAVFGLLASFLWEGFGGYLPKVMKEYPNLCKYCDSMRNEFWPDWEQSSATAMEKKQQ